MTDNTAFLFGLAYDLGLRWGQTVDDETRETINTRYGGAHTLACGLYPPAIIEQMHEAFAAGQQAGERWCVARLSGGGRPRGRSGPVLTGGGLVPYERPT